MPPTGVGRLTDCPRARERFRPGKKGEKGGKGQGSKAAEVPPSRAASGGARLSVCWEIHANPDATALVVWATAPSGRAQPSSTVVAFLDNVVVAEWVQLWTDGWRGRRQITAWHYPRLFPPCPPRPPTSWPPFDVGSPEVGDLRQDLETGPSTAGASSANRLSARRPDPSLPGDIVDIIHRVRANVSAVFGHDLRTAMQWAVKHLGHCGTFLPA
ncbi:unnamed protein product [Symbiodinium sp. CCMP2592]|nr:unnamed protein product [Symbiodinium sp. CCMP2592]